MYLLMGKQLWCVALTLETKRSHSWPYLIFHQSVTCRTLLTAWPRPVVEIVLLTLVAAGPHKAFLALAATILPALQGTRTLRVTVTCCREIKPQSELRGCRNTLLLQTILCKPTGDPPTYRQSPAPQQGAAMHGKAHRVAGHGSFHVKLY